MQLPRLAAALALLAIAQAHAADYAFTFTGTQVHWTTPFECSACPPAIVSPWAGSLLVSAPDADGVYSFADIAVRLGDRLLAEPFFEPLVVTISGAEVASFSGTADYFSFEPEHYRFDGFALHWDKPASHHEGNSFGDAQITAVVSHAPEPATYAALGTGLLLVLGALRRWRK